MDLQPAKVRELRNCDINKKLKIAMEFGMRKTTDYKSPDKYLNELAVAIDAKKSTKKVGFLEKNFFWRKFVLYIDFIF